MTKRSVSGIIDAYVARHPESEAAYQDWKGRRGILAFIFIMPVKVAAIVLGALLRIAFTRVGMIVIGLGVLFWWLAAPHKPATAPVEALPPSTPSMRAPHASREAQGRAIALFPALGIPNSPLNIRFNQIVRTDMHVDPGVFDDPEWPTNIARAAAQTP
jgi:hypothetical protein